MINISLSTTINQRIEEVWSQMTNPSNARKWMSGVVGTPTASDGPIRAGTKVRKVQRFWGLRTEMTYEVIEYEPSRRIAYRTLAGTLSGPSFYEASITLEPIGKDTKLIYLGQGKLGGLLRLVEPVFTRLLKSRFKHDFKTLRELVEAPVGAGRRPQRGERS